MKIAENIFELDNLYNFVQDGYIVKRKHPDLPLFIYNYTSLCAVRRMWNDTTLQCRGLVADIYGDIVARPFPKFFNLSEIKEIPNELFEVYEKLDGSMIVIYYYNNEWHTASRGSFDSTQARQAANILARKVDVFSVLSPYLTYVCELICPNNRIVVNYGNTEDLILTGCFHTSTGREYGIEIWHDVFTLAEKHRIDNLQDLLAIQRENAEGFVIRFDSGLRAKVKHDDYIRLHRIITGLSEHRVWEALSQGLTVEQILDGVPDELFRWATDVANNLYGQYGNIVANALDIFDNIKGETRKELALQYQKTSYASILFAMLDNREYSKLVWNMIEPEGNVHDGNI